jgi:Long-chain acyl-CoA synthetases (AMP-forming)
LNSEAFTPDGYFRTGDQGFIDDNGFLSLTGRLKELLKTSTGKYVSPNPIELEISRHPVVEQALVIANDRKFVSALVFPEPPKGLAACSASTKRISKSKRPCNPTASAKPSTAISGKSTRS